MLKIKESKDRGSKKGTGDAESWACGRAGSGRAQGNPNVEYEDKKL